MELAAAELKNLNGVFKIGGFLNLKLDKNLNGMFKIGGFLNLKLEKKPELPDKTDVGVALKATSSSSVHVILPFSELAGLRSSRNGAMISEQ